MITINYQRFGTKGFQLRLRLYQDGETKYINVTRLPKGAIKRQHWNPNKQLFTPVVLSVKRTTPFLSASNRNIRKLL